MVGWLPIQGWVEGRPGKIKLLGRCVCGGRVSTTLGIRISSSSHNYRGSDVSNLQNSKKWALNAHWTTSKSLGELQKRKGVGHRSFSTLNLLTWIWGTAVRIGDRSRVKHKYEFPFLPTGGLLWPYSLLFILKTISHPSGELCWVSATLPSS